MNKGLEYYKNLIDGLVGRKNGAEESWIQGSGYPDTPENRPYNELLASLSLQQKEVLAQLVHEARLGGMHDTLAYMNEAMDLNGLALTQNGEILPHDEFESMHFDFLARCDGAEWPE